MARQRLTASELGKLLNAAGQPIYVLDDEFVIVFLNRACHAWLGSSAEGLLGARCRYHSDPGATDTEAAAVGLCPPPGVLLGRELTATVWASGDDGSTKRRTARFLPLGIDSEDTVGTVVVLGPNELDEADITHEGEETPDELHDHIRQFRERAAGRYGANRLVGKSVAIERARKQVELATLSDASVLIIGPPGSGRTHVANAIHYGGNRRLSGMLVPLACSLLGAELIRSTVVALSSGGVPSDQPDSGSLLLSEADQIPPQVQAELADIIAAKSFPLRLIATAATPLGELAGQGSYGKKLAGVLSTLSIELPALADRREDIPALAQMFLEEANARSTGQLSGFTPEALDMLDAHAWPGNIDELAEVVAKSHARAAGLLVGVGDLPRRIHTAAGATAHPPRTEERIVLHEFLARVESELIARAMKAARGNKAKAARLLGMTRPRLYRRLLQLDLEEEV